jgi:uncharacterized membrane protein
MRAFLIAVGILSWALALSVILIFAESGGAQVAIAAGVFAVVAVVSLGCERIIKTLEDIRDSRVPLPRPNRERVMAVPVGPST